MGGYRKIGMDDWELFGEGGNGKTYINRNDSSLLLKINKGAMSTEEMTLVEFERSKNVESLGFSIPKVYEIVETDQGIGTVFQRIEGKKSLSRLIADSPEDIEKYAAILAEEGRKLHSTPCDTALFESRKEQAKKGMAMLHILNKKYRDILSEFIEAMPEVTTCVHGDFQMGNMIMSGDKTYWIDLGRFGYGDPMADIGHLYMMCVEQSKMKILHDITHLNETQLRDFWKYFSIHYTGTTDPVKLREFDMLAAKYVAVDQVARLYIQPEKLLQFVSEIYMLPRYVKAGFPEKFGKA